MTHTIRLAAFLAALTLSTLPAQRAGATSAAIHDPPTKGTPSRKSAPGQASPGVSPRERPRGQKIGLVALFGTLGGLGVLLAATARGAVREDDDRGAQPN